MGRYTIYINATEEDIEEIVSGLTELLEAADLNPVNFRSDEIPDDSVVLHPVDFDYVDYGVNPVADSDMRAYFQVNNPDGTEIYQKASWDVLLKFAPTTPAKIKTYAEGVVEKILADKAKSS